MIKLGITGGIGSGKSTVSELFSICGIPVYIADTESKRLTATSPVIREQLTNVFGYEIFANGVLDKKLLASYIFNDEKKLEIVNKIIHPVVKDDFSEWIKKNNRYSIVAQESAILFESGFNNLMDKTLTVYSPAEMRIKRVMFRDKVSREEVISRMKNQMADEEKTKLSDFVIVNDEKGSLIDQVIVIINKLKES